MAATKRGSHELQQKCKKAMQTETDPLEKLRLACLSRGANGIKGLGRSFKIMDDDMSKSLDKSEFHKGIKDYGLVELEKETIDTLFGIFDKDGSGSIDFDEFLIKLRPPMKNCRKDLISKAFRKLDKSGDGIVTVEDLKGVYNVKKHPKYISGEWTEDQCLEQFLVSFDTPNECDNKITEDEFQNYYAGVSASVDNDAYFDLMMRSAWKL